MANKRTPNARKTKSHRPPYVVKRLSRRVKPRTPWSTKAIATDVETSTNMPTSTSIQAMARKLPACNMANLKAWFLMVECEFDRRNVTCPKAKYKELLPSFTPDMVELVYDVMIDPKINTYDDIKAIILKRATKDPYAALQLLLQGTDLGGMKPSAFLRHVRILVAEAGQTWTDEYSKKFLISRMPPYARTALLAARMPLDELATIADDMLQEPLAITTTVHEPVQNMDLIELKTQVNALQAGLTEMCQARKRSSSPRPRQRPHTPSPPPPPTRRPGSGASRHVPRARGGHQEGDELCWYHTTYGSKAINCRRPCRWSGNGRNRS